MSNSFKLEHYLLGLWLHNAEIVNLKEADLLRHKKLYLIIRCRRRIFKIKKRYDIRRRIFKIKHRFARTENSYRFMAKL
ncbi:hypothetical protein CFP56_031980 [Quercus suber]|uniref:Ribosomal protein S15 n=1 Tax=Quercus suber TaxID=58331 RepID=A0AAW0JJ88_QUESU